MQDLGQAKAVAAGKNYTLALMNDGTVRSWGNNADGQLGDGSEVGSNRPLKVPGIEQVTAIAAGKYHAIALKQDGTVWTWGKNDDHQLGLREPAARPRHRDQ